MSSPPSVVRTVLGDLPAADLGVCYSHEHLVIDGGVPGIINPQIRLSSVEDAVAELEPCAAAGVATVVDAMPADAGRNIDKLAEISRRSGVHVVAVTGLHHARYYGDRHWGELLAPEQMAELFLADVQDGIDRYDLGAPVTDRSGHRAGLVKAAGSLGGLTARDRRVFTAAALTVLRCGAALMTHCEQGTGAVAQLELLRDLGVPASRIVLSHTDKVDDTGYHRELLGSGANVVYDQGLRTPDTTLELVSAAVGEGHGDQLLLGTDGARRSLWSVLGGAPGLAALRTSLGARIAERIGSSAAQRLWVTNPARVLALQP